MMASFYSVFFSFLFLLEVSVLLQSNYWSPLFVSENPAVHLPEKPRVGCVTRRTLLDCDSSIHVRVAVAAFKRTSCAGEKWTSFLG
ncbi:hypothetical protein Y032_0323g2489 [Ancylostoma ceylanicum]|uniref:Secreted protein n=1 Tax=Ancylostoma ceylanicum TaxID=53326 RepID=A0A016S0G0_9BILA|nr:hypothetical protein Y032_0323g2489 [Ancylostoma ceylanicum]